MGKVIVHRYKTWSIVAGDWVVSTRMATQEYIDNIKATRIEGTAAKIDDTLVGREKSAKRQGTSSPQVERATDLPQSCLTRHAATARYPHGHALRLTRYLTISQPRQRTRYSAQPARVLGKTKISKPKLHCAFPAHSIRGYTPANLMTAASARHGQSEVDPISWTGIGVT
jgi:hypothetical protein